MYGQLCVLRQNEGGVHLELNTVKPGLSDHPTVQAKAVVKARWSSEPGPTVSVYM